MLAALTDQVDYLMATLGTKSGFLGNPRNREGQPNKVNSPGDQGLDNKIKMELSEIKVAIVHLSSVISRQANVKAGSTEVLLDLNQIQGDIRTSRGITIPPLETVQVKWLTM